MNDLLLRRVEQTPTPLTAVRAADRLHGVDAFASSVLKRWISTQMSHAELSAWMDECDKEQSCLGGSQSFTIGGVQGLLIIRSVGREPGGRQRFELDERLMPPAEILRFGLSNRESEVLSLIVQGADPEDQSPTHLACRPATVKKHVEHIYERLGVHDRQASITFVFDTLLGDPHL